MERRGSRDAPPEVSTARHFFIREIGILAEQGVHDRARMLLARRSNAAPSEPEAYLDAMRLELGVPSSGAAWSAWMMRAFEAGVPIATYVARIVPERTLAAALLDVEPSALLRQPDRASALDLLRLRATAALVAGDPRALDVLDEGVLERVASDAALSALACAVLAARAFAEPDRVERLAARLDAAAVRPSGDPMRAELRDAIALARSYRSVAIEPPCPAPLERALGLLGRCDAAADRLLLADLERDLRAQSALYLAWADAVASAAPACIDAWLARLRSLGTSAEPAAVTDARASALLPELAAAIDSDPLRFVPLHTAEQSLYRKHVRRKVLAALVDGTAEARLAALIARGAEQSARVKRVLALLASDPALALIDQLVITSASRGSGRETTARR